MSGHDITQSISEGGLVPSPAAGAVAIVLAAGASSRMGRSKPLLRLAGRPLIEWHCLALAPFARRLVVVIGAGGAEVAAALPEGVEVVDNPDWARTTPIDSLRCGLRAVCRPEIAQRVLVTPVDVIPAASGTLEALLAQGGCAVPIGPDGRPGHPVLLDAPRVGRILEAPPPGGLRTLLGDAARVAVADPLVALDFDDPAAFDAVSARWAP